jgi:hypothetical protein
MLLCTLLPGHVVMVMAAVLAGRDHGWLASFFFG